MNTTERDYPTHAHTTPSTWLGDWECYNYPEAVRASYSTDPERLVRAARSAAHSTWKNREVIITRAVRSANFPPALAAFAFRYWN